MPVMKLLQWSNGKKISSKGKKNPISINYMQERNFALIDNFLYYRTPCGLLSQCITKEEVVKRLKEIHHHVCGTEEPPLIKRLQRAGYYCLTW